MPISLKNQKDNTYSSFDGDIDPTQRAWIEISGKAIENNVRQLRTCLLYTSPSPRDKRQSRMPSSA